MNCFGAYFDKENKCDRLFIAVEDDNDNRFAYVLKSERGRLDIDYKLSWKEISELVYPTDLPNSFYDACEVEFFLYEILKV